ncbi:hypothetical protein A9239_01690 [Methanosarcina sp. A14]|uniref:hypothetical protein n=2 Tax=Methanosarcina TaxID=2207 RepID=UPI00064FD7ED|nr:hypothetical protein [Methanosarcina barkeri]OED02088.1 hypothetical protein A9239_01690 [Methanosarcina sp. A14]
MHTSKNTFLLSRCGHLKMVIRITDEVQRAISDTVSETLKFEILKSEILKFGILKSKILKFEILKGIWINYGTA